MSPLALLRARSVHPRKRDSGYRGDRRPAETPRGTEERRPWVGEGSAVTVSTTTTVTCDATPTRGATAPVPWAEPVSLVRWRQGHPRGRDLGGAARALVPRSLAWPGKRSGPAGGSS